MISTIKFWMSFTMKNTFQEWMTRTIQFWMSFTLQNKLPQMDDQKIPTLDAYYSFCSLYNNVSFSSRFRIIYVLFIKLPKVEENRSFIFPLVELDYTV